MARTDTLTHFLTDVADAIREKKGTSAQISAQNFDTEIASIIGGGELEPIALHYYFDDNTSAYASGDIALIANSADYDGTYTLKWANADGVMTNYLPIGTVELDYSASESRGEIHMMSYKAIPKYATKIVAVDGDDETVATYNIPVGKLWDDSVYGAHGTSLMAFADSHIQSSTAESDYAAAIQFGNERESIAAMVGAGDLTDNGEEEELEEWKTIRDTYRGSTPVYSCDGNHEHFRTDSFAVANPEAIREYLDSDWTTETDNNFVKTIGGVVCIFVESWHGIQQSGSATMFDSDTLEWLESQLETYRNQRVLLFAHTAPHYDLTPSGFAYANGAYQSNLWGNPGTSDRQAFMTLLAHYKNVIWFSGHSHISFSCDDDYENLNICRWNTDGATMVHLSSLCKPRDVIEGSNVQHSEWGEVAVLDIYPNHIRMRCRDVAEGKFMGFNEYIIDTTPVTIPAKPSEDATLESIAVSVSPSSAFVGGSLGTVTVTATYDDNTTADVTSSATIDTSNVNLTTEGEYTINASYTENDVTKTASTTFTVTQEAAAEKTYVTTQTNVGKRISATQMTIKSLAGYTLEYVPISSGVTYYSEYVPDSSDEIPICYSPDINADTHVVSITFPYTANANGYIVHSTHSTTTYVDLLIYHY